MFTRHLIVAAALMAATCAANAEAVATTTTASSASDLSIVDASTSLTGADSGLASVLASTSTNLVLMRGVEGTFMLAARFATAADAGTTPADTAALIGASDATTPVVSAADPVVTAAAVPEPATLALMLAGVLGAIGFTRTRKQG